MFTRMGMRSLFRRGLLKLNVSIVCSALSSALSRCHGLTEKLNAASLTGCIETQLSLFISVSCNVFKIFPFFISTSSAVLNADQEPRGPNV